MAKRFLPKESQLKKAGFFVVAGIDEAGRGPLAGPVVSAAVILKNTARIPGLTDSKLLSAKKRENLFQIITQNALDYSIAFVSHKTIDEINILKAVQLANHLCIEALSIKPDIAIIDGRDKQILQIPFETIIKGDLKVKSIAAASILAKVARDKLMEHYHSLYPQYAFSKHMGYGTGLHKSLISEHGPCEIHRRSYNWQVDKEKR